MMGFIESTIGMVIGTTCFWLAFFWFKTNFKIVRRESDHWSEENSEDANPETVFSDWLEKTQIIISGRIYEDEDRTLHFDTMVRVSNYTNEQVDRFIATSLAHHIINSSENSDERYARMLTAEKFLLDPDNLSVKSNIHQ